MTATETPTGAMRRLEWQVAQLREVVVETARVRSLLLHVDGWRGHAPGQHVDVRLTAEDGYQAQRSYSIVSPPEDEMIALTVERVQDGASEPARPTPAPAPAQDGGPVVRYPGSGGR